MDSTDPIDQADIFTTTNTPTFPGTGIDIGPLSELADIHLPEPIGFWPPAPGWWLLGLLAIAVSLYFGRHYLANWKVRRMCNFAIRELDKCLASYRAAIASAPNETSEQLKLDFVNELNAVLRRVALKEFPQANLASLGGAQWIAFLRKHGDASLLTEDLANTLSQGRFAKHWDIDEQKLYQMAHQWISGLYLARITVHNRINKLSTTRAVSNHA